MTPRDHFSHNVGKTSVVLQEIGQARRVRRHGLHDTVQLDKGHIGIEVRI